jgi:hypothetical protein
LGLVLLHKLFCSICRNNSPRPTGKCKIPGNDSYALSFTLETLFTNTLPGCSQLYGQLYYIPFYFLSVKQASPIQTGVNLFPVICSLVPASIVVGSIVTRVNCFRWAIWSGWVITTIASGLAILWDINTPTAEWAVILVILGIGHALVLNAQNFATQAICRPSDEAAAAAMHVFLRSFGMGVGVGISDSIFQNVMKVKLKQLSLPMEIALNAESYIATLRTLPESTFKTDVLEAYVYGLRGVYGGFCGISGLAGLASLLIGHFDMNKELNSEHKLGRNSFTKVFRVADSRGPTSSDLNVKKTSEQNGNLDNKGARRTTFIYLVCLTITTGGY